ncbi:polysaccharide biosynthesis protein [Micromonospora chersina]|uniref:polysaccharide biosynthesis protein n=1 Tax=Micromonospora chersina TaxID=47854 RepID=UPI003715EFCC
MVAGTAGNALAYLVPVLAARRLDAAELGVLATALGLVAIASVPGLGLQLAVAVHHARHGRTTARRATLTTAALSGGVLVAATPLLAAVLRIPADVPALLAVTTVAVVLSSRWLGELQGGQRFLRLALGMALLAAGRYGGVILGLLLGAGLTGSLLAGALLAALTPLALARLTSARTPHAPAVTEPTAADAAAPVPALSAAQVVTGCGATLAMLVVSYADLLLARQLLPPAESGAYAVGTVLAKGALWAPQVVTVLALPRLARGDRRSRTVALALTGACGLVLVLASALGGGLAFRLAGGEDYVRLGAHAPVFAAIGALYAVVFVLLNAQVAAGARWPAAPLWTSAVGLVVVAGAIAPHTFTGLLWSALGTAVAALVAMAVTSRRRVPAAPD